MERLMAAKAMGEDDEEPVDPMADPANKAWVEKQLAEAKQLYGEDFGEDIDEDFSG